MGSPAKPVKRRTKWLRKGIIVKVVNRSSPLNKLKGEVTGVHQTMATLRMVKSGTVADIDERFLETVVPAFGRAVIVCGGKHVNKEGILESLEQRTLLGTIALASGKRVKVSIDDFSKKAKRK